MTLRGGTTCGTQGGTKGRYSPSCTAFCTAVQYRLSTAFVPRVSRYSIVTYDGNGTTVHVCAQTPHTPSKRVGLRRPRALRGNVCVRDRVPLYRLRYFQRFGRSVRRGNSRTFSFCLLRPRTRAKVRHAIGTWRDFRPFEAPGNGRAVPHSLFCLAEFPAGWRARGAQGARSSRWAHVAPRARRGPTWRALGVAWWGGRFRWQR